MPMKEPTGDYIQTYTGIKFYPLDPREEMVRLEDIAHALSNICRFNGHTKTFYSVAEHSVHVSRLVPKEFAKEALLHDASEAYLMDVPRPLKRFMCFSNYELTGDAGSFPYDYYETKLRNVIFKKFGLKTSESLSEGVKTVDNRILVTEYEQLVSSVLPESLRAIESYDPFRVNTFDPIDAKAAFMYRARELNMT